MRRTSSLGSIPLGVKADGEEKDEAKSSGEGGRGECRQGESNDVSVNHNTLIASRRSRRSAICSESVVSTCMHNNNHHRHRHRRRHYRRGRSSSSQSERSEI